jgi:hypothetical protein
MVFSFTKNRRNDATGAILSAAMRRLLICYAMMRENMMLFPARPSAALCATTTSFLITTY